MSIELELESLTLSSSDDEIVDYEIADGEECEKCKSGPAFLFYRPKTRVWECIWCDEKDDYVQSERHSRLIDRELTDKKAMTIIRYLVESGVIRDPRTDEMKKQEYEPYETLGKELEQVCRKNDRYEHEYIEWLCMQLWSTPSQSQMQIV